MLSVTSYASSTHLRFFFYGFHTCRSLCISQHRGIDYSGNSFLYGFNTTGNTMWM